MYHLSTVDYLAAALVGAAALIWCRERDIGKEGDAPPEHASRSDCSCRVREALRGYLDKRKDELPPKICAELCDLLGDEAGSGKILRPRPGARVERRIPAEVMLGDIPEGHHVWLAVEVGHLLWPKEPALLASARRWSGVVHEGGHPSEFALSLWLVPPHGHRFILEWFERAHLDGYPGLREIPGAVRLDTVKGLRLR